MSTLGNSLHVKQIIAQYNYIHLLCYIIYTFMECSSFVQLKQEHYQPPPAAAAAAASIILAALFPACCMAPGDAD
ncbi:hypothetical protein DERF_010717 [Dermatophagoides farinae]|uniref:Uncharacterized protein n=1 Tax=Dermatophagoides farinae TaxID=6954 RepID=A0A922HT70_DERFA|nr:hypothetical protein DERF_010717 [Dermatophagoides farinae]